MTGLISHLRKSRLEGESRSLMDLLLANTRAACPESMQLRAKRKDPDPEFSNLHLAMIEGRIWAFFTRSYKIEYII